MKRHLTNCSGIYIKNTKSRRCYGRSRFLKTKITQLNSLKRSTQKIFKSHTRRGTAACTVRNNLYLKCRCGPPCSESAFAMLPAVRRPMSCCHSLVSCIATTVYDGRLDEQLLTELCFGLPAT